MDFGHRLDFTDTALKNIRQDGLYRSLRYSKVFKQYITIDGHRLINLSSNDYLGIPTTTIKSEQSQSSSRLISGNDSTYEGLESALAEHKSQQSSLVFPTGYMANIGVIQAIAQKGDLIASDELNHASIIDACRLSGAEVVVYAHNNIDNLYMLLKDRMESQKTGNSFIVTEGVFSMDGDYSNMPGIVDVASKTGAITVVDDAHGDFVAGRDGRGVPDMFGVSNKVDVYTSSLSKALGAFGGYVASDYRIIQLCINRSRSFIYTSALPGFMAGYALERFQSDRETRRITLVERTKQMVNGLTEIGYDIRSHSHIIPVVVGDEKVAVDMSKLLFKKGIFVQPIRYPTVPKKQARLRVSITAWLTEADIKESLKAFKVAFEEFF